MFDFQRPVIGYPLFFSLALLILSSCSQGIEQASNAAKDQPSDAPLNQHSEATTTQNDTFLWNGEFRYIGIAPSEKLDTESLSSQLFNISSSSCRVYISLNENDRDEALIYETAITRAEQCPLCWLDSVYDIYIQGRKGIGTRSMFTDVRQPGTWSKTNNVLWFNKNETTFNKFALIQSNCGVDRMEFFNVLTSQ